MATYEVSTWAELASAYTGNLADGDIIKLVDDIDCNNEIPEGVAETLVRPSGNVSITIDGSYVENGVERSHTIRNLRTHVVSPVEIFQIRNTLTVYGIDFVNLVIDRALFAIGVSDLNLLKCRFVGRRTQNLMTTTSGNADLVMRSCYFNVPLEGLTSVTSSTRQYIFLVTSVLLNKYYAYFCRFKETYTGWDITQITQGYNASVGNLNMSGCRIEGEIVCGDTLVITDKYAYDSVIQNVVDVDIRTNQELGTVISVSAPKGVWKNLIRAYNSNDDTPYEYINVNETLAIPETSTDMTNPAKLYSDGFDIIVPTT